MVTKTELEALDLNKEHYLIDKSNHTRRFYGFINAGNAVVDSINSNGSWIGIVTFKFDSIKNWSLKKPESRKLYQWVFTNKNTGEVFEYADFLDENGFDGSSDKSHFWNDKYHRQRIGEPIQNEFIKEI